MADQVSVKMVGTKKAVLDIKKWTEKQGEAVKKILLSTGFKVETSAKEMCIHPRTKILTNDGWKPIGKLKIGDLVVTESGQFRPIEKIIKSKPPKYVRLYMQISSYTKHPKVRGKFYSITGDPEHLIKTNNGWKKFENVTEKDQIYYLASKCRECNKLCRFHVDFCSRSCQGLWQYKYGEGKKGLNIGHIKAREFAQSRDNKLIIKKLKKWRKENPEAVEAYHKRQGKTLAKFYQEYPEKHPNAICAKNHFFTKLEKKTEKLLRELNIDYIHQFKVGKYWVDFALPDLKILLECDGERWHQDKNKEIKRDNEIKYLRPDLALIHLKEDEILNLTPLGLSRYLSCGLGDIEFIKTKIIKVKKIETHKYSPYFIDLIIDGGDGTFIANGFLVHNCPVKTGRLRGSVSTNWAGSGMREGRVGKGAKKGDGVGQPPGPKGLSVAVGSNVKYARRIEHGFVGKDKLGRQYNQSGKPYLYPAFFMHEGDIEKGLKKEFKKV